MAPDWFLNQLPCCPLDGELWAGRGNFQLCRSICAGDEPDARFNQIVYAVYGCPPVHGIFMNGEIKNTNFHCTIDQIAVMSWCRTQANDDWDIRSDWTFQEELVYLNDMLDPASPIYLHPQRKLSDDEEEAKQQVEEYLNSVLEQGGEGVVIRDPAAHYKPKRMTHILKYKPFDDDEAKIVGFTSGRKTDKGSKLLGMIGSLIVEYDGKRLELAGLTDEERQFETAEMVAHAKSNPGIDMPKEFQGKHFKVGDVVTFKYRELTDDGIPKEARYWRRPMPERAAR